MYCFVRRSVLFAFTNRFCISRCIVNGNFYTSFIGKQVYGSSLVGQTVLNKRNISLHITVSNKSSKSIFEIDTNVKRDTLLFENNSLTFEVLKYFVVLQFIFWSYAAYYCYVIIKEKKPDQLALFSINLNDRKWHYGIPTAFVVTGIVLFMVPYVYAARCVKKITLLTGGEAVRLSTCHLFKTKEFMIPLNKLNCQVGRQRKKGYVPLKVANRRFYYLVDLDGKFYEPELFDVTAGAQRIQIKNW